MFLHLRYDDLRKHHHLKETDRTAMKYTISDIARIANVSTASVSRVINNKDRGVGAETRERILKVIEELGYVPNLQARSIVMSETKTLGLIVPDITNPFFPQIVRSIVQHAALEGYTVFLADTGNDPQNEENCVRMMLEKRVDGLIFAPNGQENRVPLLCAQNNVPLVQIDRVAATDGACVTVDNRKGMCEATRLLIAHENKKIAFLGGPQGVSPTTQRYEGYREAMDEAGIKIHKAAVLYGEFSVSSGISMTRSLAASGYRPTAIVAGNDLIAIGAVKALREMGLRVPEDCEVIGFDGIEMAEVIDPGISTMRQPVTEMAEEAVKMLVGMVTGKISGNRRIVFDPELVLRQSTRFQR